MTSQREVAVTWRAYQGWSGPNIHGQEPFVLTGKQGRSHLHRAFWLASMVETSGRFGAVNAYDGCGMTCGLDQKTAILPKTLKQGGLWRVTRKLLDLVPEPTALEHLLDEQRWVIAPDGVLRNQVSGNPVSGRTIREVLTPENGVVPAEGPEWDRSVAWATAFQSLYDNPATFDLQVSVGVENLALGQNKVEAQVYKTWTGLSSPTAAVTEKNISRELDLAFCVYHAYSVHAPTLAASVLRERSRVELSKGSSPEEFASQLIRDFGTHPYKRWRDQPDNKASRYDRTRAHALRSGLWAQEFFSTPGGLMPENL